MAIPWGEVDQLSYELDRERRLREQYERNVKAATRQQRQAELENWEEELEYREKVQQRLQALSRRLDQLEDLVLWSAGVERRDPS